MPKEVEKKEADKTAENPELTIVREQIEAEKKAKTATPELLEQEKQAIIDSLWPPYPPRKKEEKTEEQKLEAEEAEKKAKEEEAKKGEEKKEEEKKAEKEEKPKKKREAKPKVLDLDKELKSAEPEPEPVAKPAPEPIESKLTKSDKRTLAAMEYLEKTNPEAYAGLAKRTLDFWKSEQEYIASWEKQHAGEEFDKDAAEHESWYKSNQPEIAEDDIEEAKIAMAASRIADERLAKIEKQQQEENHRRMLTDCKQAEIQTINAAIPEFIAAADEDTRKMMKKNGEAYVFDQEVADKLSEERPLAKEILLDSVEPLRVILAEIVRLESIPTYKADEKMAVKLPRTGMSILPHAEIRTMMKECEEICAEAEPDKTLRNGKTFLTHEQYNRKAQQIISAKITDTAKARLLDELKAAHWTLGWDDLKRAAVSAYAVQAKERIKRLSAAPTKKAQATDKKEEKAVEKDNGTKEKKAPSLESASDNQDTKGAAGLQRELTGEVIDKAMGW